MDKQKWGKSLPVKQSDLLLLNIDLFDLLNIGTT
jgi:hypothetical protein